MRWVVRPTAQTGAFVKVLFMVEFDFTNVSDLFKFVSAVLYRGMVHPNCRVAMQSSAARRKKI